MSPTVQCTLYLIIIMMVTLCELFIYLNLNMFQRILICIKLVFLARCLRKAEASVFLHKRTLFGIHEPVHFKCKNTKSSLFYCA